ncbi:MAG: hypothetical protein M1298_00785 [Chloroflexi bacterium]|nr:hypothetical protein [Chloroflexota bacterium]
MTVIWKGWGLAILLGILTLIVGVPLSATVVRVFASMFGRSGSLDFSTGASVAAVYFAFVLAAVTLVYVLLTQQMGKATEASAAASRDMVTRMADSLRPLVVPVVSFEKVGHGRDGYVRIVHFSQVGAPILDSGQEWEPLFLQNIGNGPAINVGVILESHALPSESFSIPPSKGGARPIAAGGKEQAYHWVASHEIWVCEGSTLTITYDDMLGHHFQTTACRWLHDWYNIDTKPDNTPAPPREYPKPVI